MGDKYNMMKATTYKASDGTTWVYWGGYTLRVPVMKADSPSRQRKLAKNSPDLWAHTAKFNDEGLRWHHPDLFAGSHRPLRAKIVEALEQCGCPTCNDIRYPYTDRAIWAREQARVKAEDDLYWRLNS